MYRYSLKLFWPILVLLLLPALFLFPSAALFFVIALFDPKIPVVWGAGYAAWVFGPIAAAFILFISGRWSCGYYVATGKSPRALVVLWCLFSGGLFLAAWYAVSVLFSIAASDYSSAGFLSWTAGVALLITLLGQSGVIPWLLFITKKLPSVRMDHGRETGKANKLKRLVFFFFCFLIAAAAYALMRDKIPPRKYVVSDYIGMQNFSQGLALVTKERTGGDHQYGYIDTRGTVVFHGQFDYAGSFSEGLAPVQRFHERFREYRSGYIDAQGNIAIDFRFQDAKPFSEGFAAVKERGLYGYIDKAGAFVIEPRFDDAFEFSGGRAKIVMKGKCGFIDTTGTVIVEPRYYKAGSFSENLAFVADRTKCGYIDTSGRIAIPLTFDDAKPFREGMAPVRVGKKWKYIDTRGIFAQGAEFDQAEPFSEGLAVVGQIKSNFYDRRFGGYMGTRMAYGFIDRSGKYVIHPKFLSAAPFAGGLSLVSIPAGDFFGECEDYIFIDKTERQVSARLQHANSFKEGLALVGNKNGELGFINTRGQFVIGFKTKTPFYVRAAPQPYRPARYGFIDTNGTMVIPPRYFSARSFSDGLAYVDEHARGFIDTNGTLAVHLSGNMLPDDFSEGLAAVDAHDTKTGQSLHGYIDKTGTFVIPPRFHQARKFGEGLAAVKFGKESDNNWGYIDRAGKTVISPQYYGAGQFCNGTAFVEYGRRMGAGHYQMHYGFIDDKGAKRIDLDQAAFRMYSPSGLPRFDKGPSWSEENDDDEESYYSFEESLMPASDKNPPYKVGYVDRAGSFIVPAAFDGAKPFTEGLAWVRIGQKWGCIDARGKVVVEPRYDDGRPFSGERALIEENGKFGYIDRAGNSIIEPQFFEKAYSFKDGLALVRLNNSYGFIDAMGNFVIEPQYASARSFSEGLALIGVIDAIADDAEEVENAEEGNYVHARKEGLFKAYYSGGGLRSEVSYYQGKREGKAVYYHKTGGKQDVSSEGNYRAGRKEGRWVSYFAGTRQKKAELNYKDGKLDGECRWYYENGNLKQITEYKDGIRDGRSSWYYESGQLREKTPFKNDALDGMHYFYYESGQLQEEGPYRNGKEHGLFILYNKDKSIKKKVLYKDG